MSLLEHAKRELKLAGYDISDKGCEMHDDEESFKGYVNSCARNAYELMETLSKADHSGMSVEIIWMNGHDYLTVNLYAIKVKEIHLALLVILKLIMM